MTGKMGTKSNKVVLHTSMGGVINRHFYYAFNIYNNGGFHVVSLSFLLVRATQAESFYQIYTCGVYENLMKFRLIYKNCSLKIKVS